MAYAQQTAQTACVVGSQIIPCPPNAANPVGVYKIGTQTRTVQTSGVVPVNLAVASTTTLGDYACLSPSIGAAIIDNRQNPCGTNQQLGIINQSNFHAVAQVNVSLTIQPIAGSTGTLVCLSGSTLASCPLNGTQIVGVFSTGTSIATVNTGGYATVNLATAALTTLGDYACSNNIQMGTIIDTGTASCPSGQQAGFIGATNSTSVASVPVYLSSFPYNPIGGGGVSSVTVGANQLTQTGTCSSTSVVSCTLGLATTSATPGSYTSANITVDAFGRITAVTNGSGGSGGVTSVTAVSPLSSTGGATPAISLKNSASVNVTSALGTDTAYLTASGAAAGTGNVIVGDSSGGITDSLTALSTLLTTSLASGKIFVGNGSGVATAVTPSEDVSMSNAGAFTNIGINGTLLSGLGTGILKNTTGTGVPSIAVAADFPTLNQNTTGTAATITGLLALANTPLTTSQDILYDNAGSLGRLAISTVTSGQCLGNNSGVWGTFVCSGGSGSGINITINGGSNLTGPANFQNGTSGNVINFLNPSASNVQATIQSGGVTSAMLASSLTLGGTTSGTFSGPLTGNASTATAAASTPSQCATGALANGIASSFAANCLPASPPATNGFYLWSESVTGSAAVNPAVLLSTSLPAGTAIGSLDIGTPKLTFGTNSITASQPISASTFTSSVSTGTPPFTVSSTTPVANLSIGGNASGYAAGIAGGAFGSAPYQTGVNATGFIASPTTSGHTFAYVWRPSGSAIAPSALDLATYVASPPAIGGTSPNTGAFTTLLASGILDGRAPITITTSSSASLGGTYNSGYTFNQNTTAGAAVTYALPNALAGKQYCVGNSDSSGTADTGIVTVQTSGSGQYIHWNGARGASGGYIISGGAAGDKACFVGITSTDWEAYVQVGSWTLH